MRKIIKLALGLLLVCSLCGCSKKEEDTSIELTMENYMDYLDVKGVYNLGGDTTTFGMSFNFYSDVVPNIEVEGVSGFIYEDVEVVIELSGTYSAHSSSMQYENTELNEMITVDCNVGGNGSYSTPILLDGYTYSKGIDVGMNVVSVTGRVKQN